MVRDQQIKRLFDMRNKHDYPYQAVDAAGISHKTAYKYLKSGTLPNHCRIDHPGRRGDCGRKHAIVENCLAPATSHTLAGFNSTGADKLVVAVCGEGSGAVLTGVTFGGIAMTEAVFKTHTAGLQSAAVYYLGNPIGTGDIVS